MLVNTNQKGGIFINKKLGVQDFINIGIFAAIYYVCFFDSMMIGYFPALIIIISLVTGIVCGIEIIAQCCTYILHLESGKIKDQYKLDEKNKDKLCTFFK